MGTVPGFLSSTRKFRNVRSPGAIVIARSLLEAKPCVQRVFRLHARCDRGACCNVAAARLRGHDSNNDNQGYFLRSSLGIGGGERLVEGAGEEAGKAGFVERPGKQVPLDLV